MPKKLTTEQQLTIISRAWGNQDGYAFFPWIDGKAGSREERIKSYHEGPAFKWPLEKEKILAHLSSHTNDDLYWCPSLFEAKRRLIELAMDEHCLWADLDEVDPRGIEDYPPTVAWESSPGRYQALWLITAGDMQGASWQGGENQRLTYYLNADASGWDTTQLLRIPGWKNHKFEYKDANKGKPVVGELLWANGRRYLPDEFEDLPEVQNIGEVQMVLADEIDRVDRHEVYGRVRLLLPKKARQMFEAREASGDRSEQLWWLMRCLADVGCSVSEIVAVVRPSVWNKFAGRNDEIRRLTIEASKAIAQRSPDKTEGLESSGEDKPDPANLFALVETVKQPEWLVTEILAKGSCGFIAGQPKSYKSWVALDLLLSVSTGIPFLDHFPVREPGPVLYIQEEDSLPMVKSRLGKVWPGKQADKMKLVEGKLEWHPPDPREVPPINAMVRQNVVVSDPGWQAWLDEQMGKGYEGKPYALVLIDPLMMVAGEVEENRSQEMTNKIYKPLKQLAEKWKAAIVVVHHMRKGDPKSPQRGGQLMLGSVANHAWAEDSLYLKFVRGGQLLIERESKHTTTGTFKLGGLRNKEWTPAVTEDRLDSENEATFDENDPAPPPRTTRTRRKSKALTALEELGPGPHRSSVIAQTMGGVTAGGAYKQLQRLEDAGLVQKVGSSWQLAGMTQ